MMPRPRLLLAQEFGCGSDELRWEAHNDALHWVDTHCAAASLEEDGKLRKRRHLFVVRPEWGGRIGWPANHARFVSRGTFKEFVALEMVILRYRRNLVHYLNCVSMYRRLSRASPSIRSAVQGLHRSSSVSLLRRSRELSCMTLKQVRDLDLLPSVFLLIIHCLFTNFSGTLKRKLELPVSLWVCKYLVTSANQTLVELRLDNLALSNDVCELLGLFLAQPNCRLQARHDAAFVSSDLSSPFNRNSAFLEQTSTWQPLIRGALMQARSPTREFISSSQESC